MSRKQTIRKWLAGKGSENGSGFKESEDLLLLEKIQKHLDTLEVPFYDVESELSKFIERKPLRKQRQILFSGRQWTLPVAASIILTVCIYLFYPNDKNNAVEQQSIIAKTAEKKELFLPDSSFVVLNADSKVEFNRDNWAQNRVVTLTGEAYFEVRTGSAFKVVSENGEVHVLGTKFNVKVRNGLFQVLCYEGKVRMTSKAFNADLTGGKGINLLNQGPIAVDVARSTPSWTGMTSEFQSLPLFMVLEELERQYDISVTFNGVDINQLFTGSFVHGDLNLALETISVSTGTSYIFDDPSSVSFKSENP